MGRKLSVERHSPHCVTTATLPPISLSFLPSLYFLPAHCTLLAPQIATPTLDSLSAAGVRLENYYIQPVCSPTRATLMTGRYVHHHGIHTALIDSSSSALPLNETTMAERLRSAGYATHAVGKW